MLPVFNLNVEIKNPAVIALILGTLLAIAGGTVYSVASFKGREVKINLESEYQKRHEVWEQGNYKLRIAFKTWTSMYRHLSAEEALERKVVEPQTQPLSRELQALSQIQQAVEKITKTNESHLWLQKAKKEAVSDPKKMESILLGDQIMTEAIDKLQPIEANIARYENDKEYQLLKATVGKSTFVIGICIMTCGVIALFLKVRALSSLAKESAKTATATLPGSSAAKSANQRGKRKRK